MRIPIEIPFTNKPRSWISSIRSWSRRRNDTGKKQKLASRFSIPHFDADSERLFWQERQNESRNTLKAALLLGSAGFLAFIVLDIIYGRLSISDIISRSCIVLVLAYFFVFLHKHPKPESRLNLIAKISAILSVIALISMLLIEGNPVYYSETWVGLLPIYFFTYGQMFMTIAETVFFGIVAMIALPASGYLIGVGTTGLLPSIMVLQIVNLFGFCTRRQLEADARNLFQERRKAECTSENKTQFLRQLSHNLRQPLQALSCYSSVLEAAYANKPTIYCNLLSARWVSPSTN